jgi:hypothetical protein
VGFVVDNAVLEQVFSVLQFHQPRIPPNAPQSSSGTGTKVIVASVIVGSVPLHPQKGRGETEIVHVRLFAEQRSQVVIKYRMQN